MITEETLASLRDNDERLDNLFVYLDDYCFGGEGDEDDLTMLEALRTNTRVTAVDCDMHLDELGGTLKQFMRGVGRLQNLQRLRCSSSGDYAVTMAALALALESNREVKTNQLATLDLANFLLQDPTMDESELAPLSYRDFVSALRHHPTLTSFSLGFGFQSSVGVGLPNHSPREPTNQAHHTLTPLLEALTTLPQLASVRLDGATFAPEQALTPGGLELLVNSSFTTLEIQDFSLSAIHTQTMANALATNTKLRVFSLTGNDFLNIDNNDQDSETTIQQQETLTFLAQALKQNQHLRKLQLPWKLFGSKASSQSKPKIDHDQGLIELFQALEANQSIHKLLITGDCDLASNPTKALQDAFRHLLQHNYSLERIRITGEFAKEEWEQEIRLHTRLNEIGRGRLVRQINATTRSQWMEVLGQVQDDLSCLFHLLLLNPLLCSSAATQVGVVS